VGKNTAAFTNPLPCENFIQEVPAETQCKNCLPETACHKKTLLAKPAWAILQAMPIYTFGKMRRSENFMVSIQHIKQ
jgi:hypothetical protein